MSIIKILKRDLGCQFIETKNLKEGRRLKTMRFFWALAYTFKGFWIATKALLRGDEFDFTLSWWMSSWHGIYVNKRLYNWKESTYDYDC